MSKFNNKDLIRYSLHVRVYSGGYSSPQTLPFSSATPIFHYFKVNCIIIVWEDPHGGKRSKKVAKKGKRKMNFFHFWRLGVNACDIVAILLRC